MEFNEENINEYYSLNLVSRFRFLQEIWHSGAFLNELRTIIPEKDNESILKCAETFQKEDVVTVSEQENPNTKNQEKFIFISDENFKKIITEICNSTNYPFNDKLFEKLLFDKNNFNTYFSNDIPLKMGDTNETNQIHSKLLATSTAYLLLLVLYLRPSIKNNSKLNKFVIGGIVYLIRPPSFSHRSVQVY